MRSAEMHSGKLYEIQNAKQSVTNTKQDYKLNADTFC